MLLTKEEVHPLAGQRQHQKCYFVFPTSRDSRVVLPNVGFDNLIIFKLKYDLNPSYLQIVLNKTLEGKKKTKILMITRETLVVLVAYYGRGLMLIWRIKTPP